MQEESWFSWAKTKASAGVVSVGLIMGQAWHLVSTKAQNVSKPTINWAKAEGSELADSALHSPKAQTMYKDAKAFAKNSVDAMDIANKETDLVCSFQKNRNLADCKQWRTQSKSKAYKTNPLKQVRGITEVNTAAIGLPISSLKNPFSDSLQKLDKTSYSGPALLPPAKAQKPVQTKPLINQKLTSTVFSPPPPKAHARKTARKGQLTQRDLDEFLRILNQQK
jgi:hypothetical protein